MLDGRCRTVVGVAGPMYAAAVTRLALQRPGSGLTVEVVRAGDREAWAFTAAGWRNVRTASVVFD